MLTINKIKVFLSSTPFLLLFIVLMSAAFRVTNLDLIEFKTDEAINLLLSSRVSFGYPLPPGGTVSSLGILNPPFFNYLLLPFTFITHDPKLISFLIALINSVAVGFLFLAIKRYYGLTVALIACTLLAFSPWAIIYSRKIWMQDLLIPFFIPLFYSIHKLVLEKKMFYWLIYSAFSLFLIQLHQASLFLIALITIFLVYKKVEINLKYAAIGLAIGLIPLIPYINYQILTGCADCKTFLEVKNRLNVDRSATVFFRPFQITGQGNFSTLVGNDIITFKDSFPIVYKIRTFLYMEYLLLPFGLLIFIKKFKNLRFLSFSAVILPFIYYLLKVEPFIHYYIITIPLLYLFIAVGINYLIYKNLFLKVTSISLLAAIIITSILFDKTFFDLLKIRGSLGGDYGQSLIVTEKIVKEKFSKYKGSPDYDEIFISSYISLDFMYGHLPIGQMLYGKSEMSKNRLEFLEKKLKDTQVDPRVTHELFAFYTKTLPSPDSIEILRKKRYENSAYELFYKKANEYYLYKNFKKLHESIPFGYMFYYPEHWKVEEKINGILIKGDDYEIYITHLPGELNNIYSKVEIEKNVFLTITVKSTRNLSVGKIGAIDDIIASIEKI